MLKNILLSTVAIVALGAGATASFAQDMPKELRVGILGGENEADRLKNYAWVSADFRPAGARADDFTIGSEDEAIMPHQQKGPRRAYGR